MSLCLLLLSEWREEHNLVIQQQEKKKVFNLDAKWHYSSKS